MNTEPYPPSMPTPDHLADQATWRQQYKDDLDDLLASFRDQMWVGIDSGDWTAAGPMGDAIYELFSWYARRAAGNEVRRLLSALTIFTA